MVNYKIKLVRNDLRAEIWIAITATHPQHAFEIAREWCSYTRFFPDFTSIEEVKLNEYLELMSESIRKMLI